MQAHTHIQRQLHHPIDKKVPIHTHWLKKIYLQLKQNPYIKKKLKSIDKTSHNSTNPMFPIYNLYKGYGQFSDFQDLISDSKMLKCSESLMLLGTSSHVLGL